MAIILNPKTNNLDLKGAKREPSRNSNQLCDKLYPKLQKTKGGDAAGPEYFKTLLGSLESMLNKLARSTNAGSQIDEIAFVDIYKRIFIYLDNQGKDLFSTLSEHDCQIFFNATSRVATFQNAASELKEMTSEEMEKLRVVQETAAKHKSMLGSDVLDIEFPDIGI